MKMLTKNFPAKQ